MKRARIASALAVAGLLAGGGAVYLASHVDSGATLVSAKAIPTCLPAVHTTSERFDTWIKGKGTVVLKDGLGVLASGKIGATAKNVAKLQADGNALITGGKAALAEPPPAHVASWNAAFTAMVRAGDDLNAGKLTAAAAESSIFQAKIYVFDSQTP
jgi:hypothetical protein